MSTDLVHIKQEFLRFAENISVKGISRILKARTRIHRVLWSTAVVTSLSILLWQLSIIFMKYFTWPVDTLLEESRERPLFPDVTVCNLYPTHDFESMAEKISWPNYTNALIEARQIYTLEEFHRNTDLSDEDYDEVFAYLYSRTGYLSNFPIVSGNFTSDDQLIKIHKVYNWQWREIKPKTYEPTRKYHWDPNYYACRTLSVPEEYKEGIRGLTLILYIDNFPDVLQLGYQASIIRSQATGALVAIHAPGTQPNLKMAISAGPGTENNIRLSPVIRSRLPSPYSDCTNQRYIQTKTDYTDKKLLYARDLCIDICLQEQVLDQCGCLSSAFQFTPEQQHQANGTVCGNLSLLVNNSLSSINKGIKDVLCSQTNRLNPDICDNECKNRCDEMSYDLTISSAPWPHVSTQLVFAEDMIVPSSSYGSKFDIYKRMINHYYNNNNLSEILRQLENVDLIEKNFLQLNIFFEGYNSLVLKDVPSLTTDKLMGLIGGGLSLWLGISIMTLVEVLEFVYTLVHLSVRKNKLAESPAVEVDLQEVVVEKPI